MCKNWLCFWITRQLMSPIQILMLWESSAAMAIQTTTKFVMVAYFVFHVNKIKMRERAVLSP